MDDSCAIRINTIYQMRDYRFRVEKSKSEMIRFRKFILSFLLVVALPC